MYDDDEGNLIRRSGGGEVVEYQWDLGNELMAARFFAMSNGVLSLSKTVQYTYDSSGRRLSKRLDSDGDGNIDSAEGYIYDGSELLAVFDGNQSMISRYMYGPNEDQVLAEDDLTQDWPQDCHWYLADAQGSVREALTWNSPSRVLRYDSFGQSLGITEGSDAVADTGAIRFRYTGQQWDADAGLYYYKARWYDARTGRFLSEDPAGLGVDNNPFRYVKNNPISYSDPSGLCGVNTVQTFGGGTLLLPSSGGSLSLSDLYATGSPSWTSTRNPTLAGLDVDTYRSGFEAALDAGGGAALAYSNLAQNALAYNKDERLALPGDIAEMLNGSAMQLKLVAEKPELWQWAKLHGSIKKFNAGKAWTPLPTAADVFWREERLAAISEATIDARFVVPEATAKLAMRFEGLSQTAFSAAGAILSAPVALTGVGSVAFSNCLDNLQAGLRKMATGQSASTGTAAVTAGGLQLAGVDPDRARQAGEFTNLAIGLGSNLKVVGNYSNLKALSLSRGNAIWQQGQGALDSAVQWANSPLAWRQGVLRLPFGNNTTELTIAPYGQLSQDLSISGQAHHLNQAAAYGGKIPRLSGLSLKLEGNILTDVGAPHTLAHASLEDNFWALYRGTNIVPTNLQYTRALQQSLRASGALSEAQVQQAVRAAIRERVDFGLLGGEEVPNVPNPIQNLAR